MAIETRAAIRLVATDRRSIARRIFMEMDPYLLKKQFNNLDSSISFRCELKPVLTVLHKLGFDSSTEDDQTLSRDGVTVRVRCKDGWSPVLNVV